MRKYKKDQGFILTNKKAAELFCILGFARTKFSGKLKTDCTNFWMEFEKALGLEININQNNDKQ